MQTSETLDLATTDIDRTPRYAPETVLIVRKGKAASMPVLRYVAHPPNTHPGSPIVNRYTALECVTEMGSRWYGFERAWINSELRMIVSGFSSRDEVRSGWKVCKQT